MRLCWISLAFQKQCRGEEMKPNKYKPSAITTDPPPPSSSTIVSSGERFHYLLRRIPNFSINLHFI
ncbi:hypothetical protein Hanom_Chr11g00987021 [Helianthus anomalus]